MITKIILVVWQPCAMQNKVRSLAVEWMQTELVKSGMFFSSSTKEDCAKFVMGCSTSQAARAKDLSRLHIYYLTGKCLQ